jgi:hypothetical protein
MKVVGIVRHESWQLLCVAQGEAVNKKEGAKEKEICLKLRHKSL